ARAAEARARQGRAAGPRLRHAGRREGCRRPGARAPADPAAGAVGAAGERRRPRARGPRVGADAAGRGMKRTAAPKLGAYAGLAALGLLSSLVLGRPELAVLAAPFVLVLFTGLAAAREPQFLVSFAVDRDRAVEGDELSITI